MSVVPFGPGLFRVVLATMVVISHFTKLEVGRVAVVIFFVLSGYWVTHIFQKKHDLTVRSITVFYASRLLRLFPTYLFVLVATLIGFKTFGIVVTPNIHDIALFGLARSSERVIDPAWSLDIELQFYIIVPILCLLTRIAPHRLTLLIMLAGLLTLTVFAWWLKAGASSSTLANFLVAFGVGAAASFAGNARPINGRSAALSLMLFLGVAGFCAWFSETRWLIVKGPSNPIDRDIIALLWAGILVPFILWNVRQPSRGLDRTFGDLAYTIYLCQWFFVITPALAAFVPEGVPRTSALIAEIYGAAIVIYALVERPIEAMRRRILRAATGRGALVEESPTAP